MLRTKQRRHTLALTMTVLSSILLYPAAQSDSIIAAWSLLGLFFFTALLTLLVP